MVKKEYIAAAAVIFVAAAVWFAGKLMSEGDTVTVTVDGKLFGSYPLNTEAKIDICGKNILTIENGEAYMSWADCPDKLCIHQGKITNGAKSIVCLPNRVVVTLSTESQLDAVSQ